MTLTSRANLEVEGPVLDLQHHVLAQPARERRPEPKLVDGLVLPPVARVAGVARVPERAPDADAADRREELA